MLYVETNRVLVLVSAVESVANDAVVADIGNGRIVDANERVKAHGTLLAGSVPQWLRRQTRSRRRANRSSSAVEQALVQS